MATQQAQNLAQQLTNSNAGSGTGTGGSGAGNTGTGTTGTSGGGISTSSAGINSPTFDVGGTGGSLSSAGTGAFNEAQKLALQGDYGEQTRTAIGTLVQQQALAKAQKGIQGLSFAKNLGQVRQQIAQNQFENRDKLAQSGFIGSGAQDRSQVAQNQQISNTLTSKEDEFTNNLRNLNANILTSRQSELNQLAGSGALERGVVNQALRSGQDIFRTESDQGIGGKFLGIFGKDQTSSGRIDEAKFKANTKIQDVMAELGINPNSQDSLDKLNAAAQKAITTRRDSGWDLSTDIMVDLGDGPVKVDEQHMSLGRAILTETLNTVGIIGLAVPFTQAIGGVAGAGAAAAGAALEGAVGASIDGVMEGITTDLASTMGEVAGSMAPASLEEIVAAGGGATLTDSGAAAGGAIAGGINATIENTLGETIGEGAGSIMDETTSNQLANSIGTAIESSLGESVEDLPASAVNAATNAASDTLKQLMQAMGGQAGLSPQLLDAIQAAGFSSVSDLTMEDAVAIASSSAMDIIENADMVAAVAEATNEAGAGTTAAGVGETATTLDTDAAAAQAGQVEAAPEAGAGTTEGTQPAAQGLGRVKGLLSRWKGAAKAAPTTGRGLAARAATGAVKAIPKIAWNAGKKALFTDLGAVATLSSAAATEISNLVDKAKTAGMGEDELQKIGDALLQQELNK